MLILTETLTRYGQIYLQCTFDPIVRRMAEWHIFFRVIPATFHGFTNGISRMVYFRRREQFPHCDQISDWIESEQILREKISLSSFSTLSTKTFLLGGFCGGMAKNANLPSICAASQDVGICDSKILEALEALEPPQIKELIEHALRFVPDDNMVEYFFEREIAQFYLENEAEILQRFEISC